ncbi:hypothetical protein LEP1GSC168_0816 [Leptospira santarosai str. HAI134]|nr:hypothetical protein LEP1GSC168_0816 [Leptospira santarosai str. HAI134]
MTVLSGDEILHSFACDRRGRGGFRRIESFPKAMVQMNENFRDGKISEARKIQTARNPVHSRLGLSPAFRYRSGGARRGRGDSTHQNLDATLKACLQYRKPGDRNHGVTELQKDALRVASKEIGIVYSEATE